jgi:RNA polymerase sigma-70 factor (ECF subfamily)
MTPGNSTGKLMPASQWSVVVTKLRGYVKRRVDSAAADDVLGEILLRLVQHRTQLADARNPSAWVYRVAANTIADHYRRQSVEQRVFDRSQEGLNEAVSPVTDDTAAVRELAACLEPLLRRLPADSAQAVQMTDIAGMTQVAAAQQLGLSVSGMKSRVQRGRARLKEALLQCCDIELAACGAVKGYSKRKRRCDC